MTHKFVLLILSLCASSIGVSALIPLDILNTPVAKPDKTTTTTPPPPPDPVLTGARTATDRTAVELPPDIIFGDAQIGKSAADMGTASTATGNNPANRGPPGQDLNIDIDKLLQDAFGTNILDEPGTPKQTDFTAFLDLMNSDLLTSASSQSELQKALNSVSPTPSTPKPIESGMPDLGSLVSDAFASKTDTSVGIPVSIQEQSKSTDSLIKDTQTVKIPDNSIPLDFPPLPPFPGSSSLPDTLPPLPPAQTSTSDRSEPSGLPPLPNAPGLPPFSETPSSQTPDLPPPFRTPALPSGLPSLTEISRSSQASGLPSLPDLSGFPSAINPFGQPSLPPQAPQAQPPSRQLPGLPRGPFTSSIPSAASPPGLNQMRGPGNPFQAASQLLDRINNRGTSPSNTGSGPSGSADTNALSETPNDPSLLPFAENVLSQVQQLVNRLKDNKVGSPADQTTNNLPPTTYCPNGQPSCPEDPCYTSSCLNIINAQCRPSCEDCSPRYYVNDIEVTESCTIISGLQPANGGANIAPGGRGAHLFMGNNGEFNNIPPRRRPGPGGPPPGIPPLINPLTRQRLNPMFLEQLENRRMVGPRMVDPRMEQTFPRNPRGGPPPSRFLPGGGSSNIDPRFLRALVENENIARLRNRQNGPPFDPRVGRFMRPGAPPVDLQQIARARGQNLDIAAVRRFAAEQGLSGTVNLGGRDSSNRPPPQNLVNRINRQNALDRINRQNAVEQFSRQNAVERISRQNAVERNNRQNAVDFLNRQFANNGIGRPRPQGLPTGNGRLPPQINGVGNPTAAQAQTGVNEQHLQQLRTQFAAFQGGQNPSSNQPPNSAQNVPSLSIQSAQNNPLQTIQAAMRQFQRQVRVPARSPSNAI